MTWRSYEIFIKGGDAEAATTLAQSLKGWAENVAKEWGSAEEAVTRFTLSTGAPWANLWPDEEKVVANTEPAVSIITTYNEAGEEE